MMKKRFEQIILIASLMTMVLYMSIGYADNPATPKYIVTHKIHSFHSEMQSHVSIPGRNEDEWEIAAFKKITEPDKNKFRIEFLIPKKIRHKIEDQIAELERKFTQESGRVLTVKEVEQILTDMAKNLELPEKMKLYTVDSQGKQTLRTMMGGEVFNMARSTELGEFRSHLVDELASGEDYDVYKNFVVKVFNDHNREIQTIYGRGVPLDISLKASKTGGVVDSLVLTNNDSQEIEIESLESSKGIIVLPAVKNIKIAPHHDYVVEIKVNPELTPNMERGRIDEINDALLMKYEYAFDGENYTSVDGEIRITCISSETAVNSAAFAKISKELEKKTAAEEQYRNWWLEDCNKVRLRERGVEVLKVDCASSTENLVLALADAKKRVIQAEADAKAYKKTTILTLTFSAVTVVLVVVISNYAVADAKGLFV